MKFGKKIQIRPLEEQDAYTSVNWRNNPKIWELTVNRPDKIIKIEDELSWIKAVIKQKDSKRFAIIYNKNYVGNIQLTNIENNESYFGIFIGEEDIWGKGVGYGATNLILSYAFKELQLKKVKLRVRIENIGAQKIYNNIGFKEVLKDGDLIHMEIKGKDFL